MAMSAGEGASGRRCWVCWRRGQAREEEARHAWVANTTIGLLRPGGPRPRGAGPGRDGKRRGRALSCRRGMGGPVRSAVRLAIGSRDLRLRPRLSLVHRNRSSGSCNCCCRRLTPLRVFLGLDVQPVGVILCAGPCRAGPHSRPRSRCGTVAAPLTPEQMASRDCVRWQPPPRRRSTKYLFRLGCQPVGVERPNMYVAARSGLALGQAQGSLLPAAQKWLAK